MTGGGAAATATLTPEQRARERSILLGTLIDLAMLGAFLLVGILGGSLTIVAESVRGGLMLAVEAYSLVVMRRIHRGRVADLDFGAGKLEQVCNLAIALGMLGGSAWIAGGAAELALRGRSEASPLGLALAASLGAVNNLANFVTWDEMRRAARAGGSVIMQAQLRARTTKLVASAGVQATMTVAALAVDPVVAAWADGLGALFVSGLTLASAVGMFRSGLPDLLDRSLDEAAQFSVLRALALHFDNYARFDRVRSRRSGSQVFVEIALGFDAGLPLAEVDRRATAIRAAIAREIEGADVSILVSAHPPAPGAPEAPPGHDG